MSAHPSPPPRLAELSAELRAAFRAWETDPEPWSESALDAWARRVFELQYEENRPFRRFCQRREVRPGDVDGWRRFPSVPTAGFRAVSLCVGGEEAAALVFLTSGTTRGPASRGRHPVPEPSLYDAALGAGFRRQVLDGAERARIGSLIPPFEPRRESSLSWMAEAVLRRFGADGSRALADPSGLRTEAAERFAGRACGDDVPVVLLATTLALDDWTRALEDRGARFPLPDGSRIMDTGGEKGRAGLRREDVVHRTRARLGVPPRRVVNEFGMTELLSQRYSRPPVSYEKAASSGAGPSSGTGAASSGEAGTRKGGTIPEAGPLWGPPWLRTRALDPVTLDPLPDGEVGVLCHFDLANAGSVCAVLTEDLGSVRNGALRWHGRSPGAPPRGCSLATAELLASQAGS